MHIHTHAFNMFAFIAILDMTTCLDRFMPQGIHMLFTDHGHDMLLITLHILPLKCDYFEQTCPFIVL